MDKGLQRYFSVGSEWLYYKIYTGHKTADLILTEIIKPITTQLIEEEVIDKWFFIRYADPKHHLRVRFHCKDRTNLGKVITTLHEPLNQFLQEDLIWKIQMDTYKREVERYGENTMVLSETLFYYESVSTIQFLDLIEGDGGERLRWLFGLRAINGLLDIFEYSLHERLNLMKSLKIGFGQEFGMSRPLKKQLDDKYRKERQNIEAFMIFTKETEPDYKPILDIFKQRSEKLKPIAKEILVRQDGKEVEMNYILGSYIHMLMNRLFKSKNRLNEMVCYDFLYRYLRTTIALQKNTPI